VPEVSSDLWLGLPLCELTLSVDDGARLHRVAAQPPLLLEYLHRFSARQAGSEIVPNTVHAVHIGGGAFPGYACLSLLTASLVWNPEQVVLHVDVLPPDDKAWACATSFAQVEVHGQLSAADRTTYLPRLRRGPLLPQHTSDLIRARVLVDEGGIYLDSDTYALAGLAELRRYPFTMGYEGSRWSSGKLNNGLMLSQRGAPFAQLLRDSYRDWDGSGWDQQSCRTPFVLALAHPELVHVENYPERRWPTSGDGSGGGSGYAVGGVGGRGGGDLKPPRVGIFSGRVQVGANLSAAFDGCIALHLSGMGSKHNTAKNQDRKRRGYLHYVLANALARMVGRPEQITALAGAHGAVNGQSTASPSARLCSSVFFVRRWLHRHKDRMPHISDLPAPSTLAPAECAHPQSRPPRL
jgi:hypothetical protein